MPWSYATRSKRWSTKVKNINKQVNKLNNDYNPTNITKIKEKDDTLKSGNKLFFIREDIINAFKKGIFPYIDGFQEEKTKTDANAFNEQII